MIVAEVSVSRQQLRRPDQFDHDSEELQGSRGEIRDQQECDTPHVSAFVCDGTPRSGCRSADNRSSAGPQEFQHDADLSARATSAHGVDTEPHRLAAGAAITGLASATQQQPLTVSSLLRQYVPDYVAQHRQQAAPQVQSTLAKLSLCRTAAMGSHRYHCDTCDTRTILYNSCGDRHCPQCAGAKRADWLAATSELLFPDIRYFQAVFTIPDQLSSLALGNRREIYDLLFHSAWQSLREVIADEQGFEAAAAMVLHTWNQKLESHAHVHALVPGGGPSLTGERRWVSSRRPGVRKCDGTYLVDADKLRLQFRTTFLAGLRRLSARGELKLQGEWAHLLDAAAFETWLAPLEQITRVAYIEPPPTAQSTPAHVVKYLARYLTGGPISDRRLISHENGEVTFLARTGKTTGGDDETEPVTLPGVEFVRRWSLHILPKGYTKTRRFGGFSNHHQKRYIAECAALLRAAGLVQTPGDSSASATSTASPNPGVTVEPAESSSDRRTPCCPTCKAKMRCLAADHRTSWKTVMRSHFRPRWYSDG